MGATRRVALLFCEGEFVGGSAELFLSIMVSRSYEAEGVPVYFRRKKYPRENSSDMLREALKVSAFEDGNMLPRP